jgi:tetratricopeptide (TPR) repeat protein
MHRLVQAVVREWIPETEQHVWARAAARALNKAFPEASYPEWPLCDRLLPHAKAAANWVSEFGLTYVDVGFLLNEAAAFMRLRAYFHGSQQMHTQSLAFRQRDLLPDDPAVAESLNDSAFVYLDLYQDAKAEPLFRQALEICQKSLPESHSQQVLHLNNLGVVFSRMGKCAMAERLLKQAEDLAKKASEDHLYMYAVVLNSLAELYLKQGRIKDAQAAGKSSLVLRERIGNPEKLARSLVTLGEIESRKGNYGQAETWFTRALNLKGEVHGPEHPDLIPALIRYSRLLYKQGRSQEARDLEIRAEHIRSRFGLPHYVEIDCIDSS